MQHESIDFQSPEARRALRGVEVPTAPYPAARSWSGGRRRVRGLDGIAANYFHVMSRTCGGDVFFDDIEKEALKRLLLRLSEFAGVQVLTYCVMGNHFHALIEVPHKPTYLRRFTGQEGERRLLEHLRILYSKAHIEQLKEQLIEWRRLGMDSLAQAKLEGIKRRMCDVTCYVKEVKERFSRWYNKRHGRKGTLWMDRFKSVLVEGPRRRVGGGQNSAMLEADALRTMALYIDLNPVRAGLVGHAREYEWSGYGDASRGTRRARRGLCKAMGKTVDGWEREGLQAVYEGWLEYVARQDTHPKKNKNRGSRKHEERATGARTTATQPRRVGPMRLSLENFIRRRVRHFSDGLVVGSREFVESWFGENRGWFGPRRQSGALRIPRCELPLFSLRQLRNGVGSSRDG